MNENTAEIVEELEPAEEEQVSDEELIAAMDEELAATDVEAEPEDAPVAEEAPVDESEPEPEPEPTPDEPEAAEPEPEPEPEDKPEPEAKAEEPKPEEAKEEKPSDEFGTLEDGVPEKTRERFQSIKDKYDEMVAERDAVRAEADKWVETITGTGTNPQQFGMALTWLSKVNSRDPKDLEDAYQIMLNEVQVLGKQLGKSMPGHYDPLDEYPDLKEKVDDGLMDEVAAQEVAEARAMRKLADSSRQSQQQEKDQTKLYNDTMSEVRKFGLELQRTDPHFNSKMQYIEPIISAVITGGAPTERWLPMIKAAYEKLPNPVVAPSPPKPHVPDPIRPTGTTPATSAMEKEPGNELEALNQALARGW